jgi:uncharacterized protein YoxC
MPKSNTILQVFVASPADVAEERRILESVILDTNRIWSSNLGLTFELLNWEKNVHPGFSSDPQAVINEQIGHDYDVFIGIFWGRLGSPTPRAQSGSLEEFERALSKYKSSGNHYPKIMIYFKDAPLAPSKVDATQLGELQAFKDSLSDMGGLYSVFEDSAGLESSLRAHLTAIAQKFIGESDEQQPTSEKLQTVVVDEDFDDEDYGYLDYIEIHEAKMAEMSAAMNVIEVATRRVGEQVTNRTEESPAILLGGAHMAKRFFKRTADDLTSYAENLAAQVPIFSTSRVASFDALTNALAIHGEFKNKQEQLIPLKESLLTMSEQALYARNSMSGMRESANGLPRLSKELNKAKRQVVNQLDALVSEIDSLISTVSNIIKSIDRMLDE